MIVQSHKVTFFSDLCLEVPADNVPEFLNANVICEHAMNVTIYTMRHIMSTDEDNLADCLSEILVKRSHEINYIPFSKKDHLCAEMLQLIAFADDPMGRAVMFLYLQQSSLPIMKIICVFMNECFKSKFALLNNIVTNVANCVLFFTTEIFLYYDIDKQNIIPVITLLRLERILIFLYSYCQHSSEFCRHIASVNCIQYFKVMLGVYHRINSRDNLSEVYYVNYIIE